MQIPGAGSHADRAGHYSYGEDLGLLRAGLAQLLEKTCANNVACGCDFRYPIRIVSTQKLLDTSRLHPRLPS